MFAKVAIDGVPVVLRMREAEARARAEMRKQRDLAYQNYLRGKFLRI